MGESIFDEQKCRVCGCTWDNACEGGCYWIEDNLCSACAEKMIPDLNMKCGVCPIIDYCNSYDDTAPCCQSRFEKLKVSDFINVCDYLENRSLWEDEEELEEE